MPLKVTAKLGDNTFQAEGDFVFDADFNAALALWINSQGETVPGRVASLVTALEGNQDRLQNAVEAGKLGTTGLGAHD